MSDAAALEVRFPLRQKPRIGAEASGHAVRSTTGQLPRITQVLALAIHFDDMIRRGDAKDYANVARLTGLCRERVSQIARLNYLAPDIQIELLYLPPTPTGRFPISEAAVREVANMLSWGDQRRAWAVLKQRHSLTG